MSGEFQTHLGSRGHWSRKQGPNLKPRVRWTATPVARNPVTCVLVRRGHRETQTQRDREESHGTRRQRLELRSHKHHHKQLGEWGGIVSPSELQNPAGTNPAHTWIADLEPPERERINFCCFKLPGLRSFVPAALGNEHTSEMWTILYPRRLLRGNVKRSLPSPTGVSRA